MPRKTNRTKLPAIKQLPSGAYNARAYAGKDPVTGKADYRSFTNYDYNALLLELAQFKMDRKQAKQDKHQGKSTLTLGQAIDEYIQSKSAVISPSTVVGYRKIRRTNFQELMDVPIDDLDQNQIQIAVNRAALTLSTKSIRNAHGLVTAVLKMFRPDFALHTTLPRHVKADIQIPDETEIKRMIETANGTDMEIPLLLGACCGMRRSEIAALTWDCVDFKKNTLTIKSALVLDEHRQFVAKGTKTAAGTRTIRMVPVVRQALQAYKETWDGQSDRKYITITPTQITKRFTLLQQKAGINHYRFHDLRHYTVSVMISLNIPKKYIADYVGHENEDMIDRVYTHIMASKKADVEDRLQEYYSQLF